jgi:hypothetical protein
MDDEDDKMHVPWWKYQRSSPKEANRTLGWAYLVLAIIPGLQCLLDATFSRSGYVAVAFLILSMTCF